VRARVVQDKAVRHAMREAFREGMSYAHNWLSNHVNASCQEAAQKLICNVVWHEKAVEKYPDPEPELRTTLVDGVIYRYNPKTMHFEYQLSDQSWVQSARVADHTRALYVLLENPYMRNEI
jgi:hypothetical protein